ncbi:MAG: M28 family peptidase [Bryobacteraceae bacterium]
MRSLAALVLFVSLLYSSEPPKFAVTPGMQAAIEQVSPDSLKGNLSFIASDLLEGRNTPSPGLDLAAEYIAAQLRRAGLEPGGDDEYFQTAKMFVQEPNTEGFELKISDGGKNATFHAGDASIALNKAMDLSGVPVFKLNFSDAAMIQVLTAEQIDGKVVFTEFSRGAMRSGQAAMSKLRTMKPALLLVLDRTGINRAARGGQLYDPENHGREQPPRISISGEAAAQLFDAMPAGLTTATASIHAAAPKQQPVTLRNVVAILRGSDPALKETCVLVTAHYDHLGVRPAGEGDRIFNGANDDGSGTVSVIELATALSKLKQRPKRSIVFVTFFGEEKGGFGARYYANHPVFPIAKTVADVNLEQVGRTDSTQGPQIANATLTGFDYSNVADFLKTAGEITGVKVYKDEHNSDSYFGRSDNQAFAEMGVPSHTLCVAFQYSDYHGVGDEWRKIDYANMAKVDQMVALGLIMLADSREVPHWDPANSKAAAYLKAWKGQHPSDLQ